MKRLIRFETPRKLVHRDALMEKWETNRDPMLYPAYPLWGYQSAPAQIGRLRSYTYSTNFEGKLYIVHFWWAQAPGLVALLEVDAYTGRTYEEELDCIQLTPDEGRKLRTRWLHRLPEMLVERML